MDNCVSCGIEVRKRYVKFGCPQCGEEEIVRCRRCRKISSSYECSECGFVGP